mmetsp:Transcript_9465/g.18250  ORF Transcript_9465/g.18250 Transcript_9465/m.18250 type:complete len:345 (+) Transcript_9465:1086-2120(+)
MSQKEPRLCFTERPKSNSTVISVFIESSESRDIASEMQVLEEARLKALKKPVHLNVMVVGDSSLGKTTFIEAFIAIKFRNGLPDFVKSSESSQGPTPEITHHIATKIENEVEFIMDMIDVPGYGSFTRLESWLKMLQEFLSTQAIKYANLSHIPKLERPDPRVHLCLYFIQGTRLKEADIQAMYVLQKYVNIIPVIAKADMHTADEIVSAKLNIALAASAAQISFFDCVKAMGIKSTELTNGPLGPCPPFALVSSLNMVSLEEDRFVFGRKYPWGVCDITDPEHSDFSLLSHLLVSHLVQPAIDSTKVFAKALIKKPKLKREASSWKWSPVVFGLLIGLFSLRH